MDCDELRRYNNSMQEANKYLQQRLALKDLENLRLREALDVAVEYQRNDVVNFHQAYAGYKENKHEQYDEDLKLVEDTLSTPPQREDLDAYVDAQLGEPVAWLVTDFNSLRENFTGSKDNETKLRALGYRTTPLYAKKG